MTDREKLIELLGDYFDIGDCTPEDIADHLIANGVTFAKDTDVPSKWISVEDRLPTGDGIALCYSKHDEFMVMQWDEGYGGWVDNYASYGKEFFPYWMPLPQPPRRNEDG